MLESFLLKISAILDVIGYMLVGFVFAVALLLGLAFVVSRAITAIEPFAQFFPRLFHWGIISVALLGVIGLLAPQNITVIVYKICLVTLGSVLAYYIDRAIFPYARPHKYSHCEKISSLAPQYTALFAASMLRRSLIVLACILGLTLGL